MSPIEDFVTSRDNSKIRVDLEPAVNLIYSLMLLAKADDLYGLGSWVTQTIAEMSPELRQRNRFVMFGFHFLVSPDRSWPTFPAYLRHLENMDPVQMRDRLMEEYARLKIREDDEACALPGDGVTSQAEIDLALQSSEEYLAFLRRRFPNESIEPELETEAYQYVIDPPRLKSLIVTHMNEMWEKYLQPEWHRIQPVLQGAVQAFRQVDFSGMDPLEAARQVTGQDLQNDWKDRIEKAERLIFVPSTHIGPYLGKNHSHRTLWVIFGARLPEGSLYDVPELSRAEVLVRLAALADETRLRILQIIVEQGELRSQDIMQALDLSQSAVSRHLTQLSATGYLIERRCDGAKCYAINPDRIEDTLRAVRAFLLGKKSPAPEASYRGERIGMRHYR